MTEILHSPKILSMEQVLSVREDLGKHNKKIVLTNGCFDILHPGHISSLEGAAKLGDSLFVAINSAKSIGQLKGPSRPFYSDLDRAYMLAALECVAFVFIFEGLRLDKEILKIKPDIYVKAGDYTLETLNIDERNALEKVGASIHFIPFLKGYSTSNLVSTIKSRA